MQEKNSILKNEIPVYISEHEYIQVSNKDLLYL